MLIDIFACVGHKGSVKHSVLMFSHVVLLGAACADAVAGFMSLRGNHALPVTLLD